MLRPAVLSVLAVSLLAAGCGNSNSSSSTETQTVTVSGNQPLSKSEFIAQADELCATSQDEVRPIKDEISELSASPDSTTDLKELSELFREGGDLSREMLSTIRRTLEPPAEDKDIVEAWLGKIETGLNLLEEFADTLEDGDLAESDSLSDQIDSLDDQADGIAQGYGFKVCGTND